MRPLLLTRCLGLAAIFVVGVLGCDGDSPTPQRSPEDQAATLREAVIPPGAEVTGSTVTTDDEGRAVRVTTFEALPTPVTDLTTLRASCARADHAACASLADALLSAGEALEAEEIWFASCMAGHGPSCADLGYQYNNPYIHLAHPERALDVLSRACDAPEHPPIACASLAERYGEDAQARYGTAPDPARHRALLERACRDGHYWSCDAIGTPMQIR
ncbi:MAG: sel1 repeat family protein [Deltaproteobacteria bacterium]|nr:sel1 repeat family protein [Deltaproteobacteria bacterium]